MIDRDYIFELISEMAESDGLSPRDFIENLYAERNSNAIFEEEVNKNNRYNSFENGAIEKDVAEFRRLFPDVKTESIPEEVWNDAANGAGLTAAYALYSVGKANLEDRASNVNAFNGGRSAASSAENDGEEHLTEKQVSAMKSADIKRNYKSILKSMKKW
ncbi:MAG: hypothetical protein PHY15_02025 [Eubacteriales bacterium]|nr:hypothetical protein [Eubacteriales bacterium]MDD4475626.1 hypothetical protein [Eubacteriales bacterium]